MAKLYEDIISRGSTYRDDNEKILSAYDKMLMNEADRHLSMWAKDVTKNGKKGKLIGYWDDLNAYYDVDGITWSYSSNRNWSNMGKTEKFIKQLKSGRWRGKLIESEEINEAKEDMKVSEFITSLENAIKKSFPRSFIRIGASKNLGSSISLTFALGKDKSEFANGIIHNDPLHHNLMIAWNQFAEDHFIKDKITLDKPNIGGLLTIKPEAGSHMAYGRVKLGLRKKTATPEGIIKYLDGYFKEVKRILKDNMDNLTDEHRELAKKKI